MGDLKWKSLYVTYIVDVVPLVMYVRMWCSCLPRKKKISIRGWNRTRYTRCLHRSWNGYCPRTANLETSLFLPPSFSLLSFSLFFFPFQGLLYARARTYGAHARTSIPAVHFPRLSLLFLFSLIHFANSPNSGLSIREVSVLPRNDLPVNHSSRTFFYQNSIKNASLITENKKSSIFPWGRNFSNSLAN